MKIWIVTVGDSYSGDVIHGVFATKEAAEKHVDGMPSYWKCDSEIKEHEVQA